MRRTARLLAAPLLLSLLSLLGCPPPPGVDGGVDDVGVDDGGFAGDGGLREDGGAQSDAGGDAGVLDDGGAAGDAGPSDGACASSPFPLPSPAITRSGRYERIAAFPMGDDLLLRDLVVYLPPSYDTAPERRYPVLYLHDGQNLFEAANAAFGVEWQVDETVDALSASGQIAEVIVVGIENTAERIRDYTPDVDPAYGGGGGDIYLDALVERVKPFIDDRYRTRCERAHTAIAGSSLGGLISFRALERHGDVFGRVACLSSSFWWNDQSAIRRFSQSSPSLPLRLWIDGGSAEGDAADAGLSSVLADNRAVLARALALGAVYGETVALLEDPGAPHNEAAWAARLPSVLGWLLSDDDYVPEAATELSVITWAKRLPVGGASAITVELSFDGARVTWPTNALSISLLPAGVVAADAAGFVEAEVEGAALVVASIGTLAGDDVVQVGHEDQTAVGFEVRTPPAEEAGETVYVTGNAAGLGSWDPAGLALTEGVDGRFRGVALVPREQGYEYKYTRGSWETVEKGVDGEELANRTGHAGTPHVRRDEVATWAAP